MSTVLEPDRIRAALAPELEIVRRLGEGAFAEVYLAREPALKRTVAVKVLRPEVAADEVARQRFEREAQTAARVTHPNVTAVYRVGRIDDAIPYIVMEYVDGRTLSAYLESRGPLTVDETRRILASVASALAAAHRKGIVHRDLRPGNIMHETESGRIVLVDFGLAGIIETGSHTVIRLTKTGQTLGDPLHMSPEQLRGEAVTQESDVYALGILAYELLTGAGPYGTLEDREPIAARLAREPRPLHELRRDADAALSDLVRRCLAKSAEHRPRASEVFEALMRAPEGAYATPARGVPVPPPPAPTGRFQEFVAELKRRRVVRAAITYVAAAFIALQALELLLPALVGDPDAWFRGGVALALAGFPLVLVLSWLYDVSAAGVRRTTATQRAGSTTRRVVLPIVGLVLSVGLALAVWFAVMR